MLRKLHKWVGAIGCLFILVISVTGIILDHRDELAVKMRVLASNGLRIDSGAVLDKLTITPARAIEMALAHFGPGAQLHKIELKAIRGGLVYKLESDKRQSIHIDPANGQVYLPPAEAWNIVRWAKMIHTGEGLIENPWLYDMVALALIGLSATGLWLFSLPYRRRRFKARVQAATN